MISNSSKIIAAVKESQKNGKLVFFIGAGVSITQGFPTWDKYVKDLIQFWKYHLNELDRQDFTSQETAKVLETLESDGSISNPRKIDILHSILKSNSSSDKMFKEHVLDYERLWFENTVPTNDFNPTLEILAKLSASYLTTNYDEMIEKSIGGKSFDYNLVKGLDDNRIDNILTAKFNLIHIHGSVKGGNDSFINSEEKYQRMYYFSNFDNGFKKINEFLQGKTLVIIGSSLQEDQLLRKLALEKTGQNFAFLKSTGQVSLEKELQKYYLQKYRINVIWYGESFEDLPKYFESVETEVNKFSKRNRQVEGEFLSSKANAESFIKAVNYFYERNEFNRMNDLFRDLRSSDSSFILQKLNLVFKTKLFNSEELERQSFSKMNNFWELVNSNFDQLNEENKEKTINFIQSINWPLFRLESIYYHITEKYAKETRQKLIDVVRKNFNSKSFSSNWLIAELDGSIFGLWFTWWVSEKENQLPIYDKKTLKNKKISFVKEDAEKLVETLNNKYKFFNDIDDFIELDEDVKFLDAIRDLLVRNI